VTKRGKVRGDTEKRFKRSGGLECAIEVFSGGKESERTPRTGFRGVLLNERGEPEWRYGKESVPQV